MKSVVSIQALEQSHKKKKRSLEYENNSEHGKLMLSSLVNPKIMKIKEKIYTTFMQDGQ